MFIDKLEQRRLLAAISLDTDTHNLKVTGGASGDFITVKLVSNGTQLEADDGIPGNAAG